MHMVAVRHERALPRPQAPLHPAQPGVHGASDRRPLQLALRELVVEGGLAPRQHVLRETTEAVLQLGGAQLLASQSCCLSGRIPGREPAPPARARQMLLHRRVAPLAHTTRAERRRPAPQRGQSEMASLQLERSGELAVHAELLTLCLLPVLADAAAELATVPATRQPQ